ncbi:MAG: hypothetical protein KDK96_07170 [Chlamydiia bacterium]|nr:hypothetical protein [Chlamydiia bacterium]
MNAPRQAYSKLAIVAFTTIHQKITPPKSENPHGGGRRPEYLTQHL